MCASCSQIPSLADLVQPEQFKNRYHHNQANREPNAFVITLAKTLIQVAQYHTGATPLELEELKRFARNLPVVPDDELTEKNKGLLRQLESERLRANCPSSWDCSASSSSRARRSSWSCRSVVARAFSALRALARRAELLSAVRFYRVAACRPSAVHDSAEFTHEISVFAY